MKKFYAFLYIYDEIIALIISFIISLLIAASLIAVVLLSTLNYPEWAGLLISTLVSIIFMFSWLFIWAYLVDIICNFSYLKIYKDDKFYHRVWLKKQKHL